MNLKIIGIPFDEHEDHTANRNFYIKLKKQQQQQK